MTGLTSTGANTTSRLFRALLQLKNECVSITNAHKNQASIACPLTMEALIDAKKRYQTNELKRIVNLCKSKLLNSVHTFKVFQIGKSAEGISRNSALLVPTQSVGTRSASDSMTHVTDATGKQCLSSVALTLETVHSSHPDDHWMKNWHSSRRYLIRCLQEPGRGHRDP